MPVVSFATTTFCWNFIPAIDHHKLRPDLSCWNCESGLSTCAGCPAIARTVEGLEVCGTAWFILETTSSAIWTRSSSCWSPIKGIEQSSTYKTNQTVQWLPLGAEEQQSPENQSSCLVLPQLCSPCHPFRVKLQQHRYPNLRRCRRKSPPTFCTCDNALKRGNEYLARHHRIFCVSFEWMTDLTCPTWPPAPALMSQCSFSSFQKWTFACRFKIFYVEMSRRQTGVWPFQFRTHSVTHM